MELFEIPFYDDDFIKLGFRYLINFVFSFVLIKGIYYSTSKRKDYLFTYFMISTVVFLICFTLKKFELGLGMALGLFAIFGILRYRTDTIPIKEMTYLFVVIGMAVINALANKKMSFAEILLANTLMISIGYILEKVWLLKHETRKNILYDRIEYVKPAQYDQLKSDLEDRTGLVINRVEVGKIDLLRDTANIRIFYYDHDQLKNFEEVE